MSPAEASSRPAIRRSAVLLPQPDGPTSTRNSLSWIWIVRSLTARTSPKILLTWSRVTPAIGKLLHTKYVTHGGGQPCALHGRSGAGASQQRCVRSIPQPADPVQPLPAAYLPAAATLPRNPRAPADSQLVHDTLTML